MFVNEYLNHEHHKDLLREANQQRLAHEMIQSQRLTQRIGKQLLKLSLALADQPKDECTHVEVRGQVVMICTA
jgi:hypothetical protein